MLELEAARGKRFFRRLFPLSPSRYFRAFGYYVRHSKNKLRYKLDPVGTLLGSSHFTHSILDTPNKREIFRSLDAFCITHLGSGMAENFFCELSVGAAFGLRLKNGRRVVVKAHPLYRSLDFLQAVHKVQYHLYNHSFPCPKPVIGPSPFRNGLATTEEFVRKGEFVDAHDPAIRRKMAQTLAQVIDLTKSVPDD